MRTPPTPYEINSAALSVIALIEPIRPALLWYLYGPNPTTAQENASWKTIWDEFVTKLNQADKNFEDRIAALEKYATDIGDEATKALGTPSP